MWNNLLKICRSYPSLLVAFSGGVDSALVAYAASKAVKGPVLLVFCRTELTTDTEEEQAQNLATQLKLPLYLTKLAVLTLPEVANNRRERCYACKRALLSHLCLLAAEKGLAQVAEGSNADDLRLGKRPGQQACIELNILQPLAEAAIGKQDVRNLAKEFGLPNHDQPARPCLATRFPYNTLLKPELLSRVAAGEQVLANLGCQEFRLRIHGDICRIETTLAERELIMRNSGHIEKALLALGWSFATYDLGGLKSGCYDEKSISEGVAYG